jgi:hypothetical protein
MLLPVPSDRVYTATRDDHPPASGDDMEFIPALDPCGRSDEPSARRDGGHFASRPGGRAGAA